MKLALIHNGVVYEVIDEIDQFNLDRPLARAEVAIAVQLRIIEVKRGEVANG